ncbi:MAG: hypothetical protein Q4D07_01770 [Selenomonadaceae bacterium]|nr:hypothetical protein [Selenomonadaceae bacterium]
MRKKLLAGVFAAVLGLTCSPSAAGAAPTAAADAYLAAANTCDITISAPATVSIPYLPQTLDEFKAMDKLDLTKPENTVIMYLAATNLFAHNEADGIAALNMLAGPRPLSSQDIYFYRERLKDKKYLMKVYFHGATPENNYEPEQPYTLTIHPDAGRYGEEGYCRVFLKAPAFDSPRPVTLRYKPSTGEYFIWNMNSILVGVRTPRNQDPWA